MRMIALALLALPLPLLAGCADLSAGLPFLAGDDGEWSPDPCDASEAGALSRNAPLAAGFRQAPERIAADLGEVLGDPVAAPLVAERGEARWMTGSGGSIALSLLPDGRFFMAYYSGPAKVDRHVVEALLRRWSVDVDRVWMGSGLLTAGDAGDGPAFQMAHGLPVAWANGGATWGRSGDRTRMTLLPFYDLPPLDDTLVDPEDARWTARAFAMCTLDRAGFTLDAGYAYLGDEVLAVGVLEDSLSLVVAVETTGPGCHPQGRGHIEWVYVDATTGAVAGSHAQPCVAGR